MPARDLNFEYIKTSSESKQFLGDKKSISKDYIDEISFVSRPKVVIRKLLRIVNSRLKRSGNESNTLLRILGMGRKYG